MKYLVCGFYGNDNLGDVMFETAFKHLLKDDELTFINISDISEAKLNFYNAVIVGGGDVMNDFYGIKYKEALSNYNGYKIAISVGFSFEECRTRDFVDYFDDIILRSSIDLKNISRILGSKHTHTLPDLGFSIPFPLTVIPKTGKNVGIFLVGSLMNNHGFMFTLMTYIHWLISNDYIIQLIPMYSEIDIKDNDIAINKKIYRTFKYTGAINICDKLTLEEFFDKISYLDYAVCFRFHSMVFCTRAGIPFVSMPLTRKVELYNKELPHSIRFEIRIIQDKNYEIQNFDINNAKSLFLAIVENRETIKLKLLDISAKNNTLFESNKIKTIIHNSVKRRISQPIHELVKPEEIYSKYFSKFLAHGINAHTDDYSNLIDKKTLHGIADELCYDITHDTCNDYIYGTRINLETKLKELRDMIYYIFYDHKNKTIYPKLNINYIKQDCFKGLHRAGWQYSIEPLYYFSDDYGVFLDTYTDRTFGWCSSLLQKVGILPYTNYWVGFIHHTFDTFFSTNNCTEMFSSKLFIDSLPLCKGLYCLTEYLSEQVRKKLKDLDFNIKVVTLMHPTIFPDINFTMDKYINNKSKLLINIGSWYRNPVTIHRLNNVEDITITTLRGKKMESNFPGIDMFVSFNNHRLTCEDNIWSRYLMEYLNDHPDDYSFQLYNKINKHLQNSESINIRNIEGKDLIKNFIERVQVLETLPDNGYDVLLSQNIVFLHLIDASVANTIIECIVRNTPMIINRIPPTVELLGQNYPLFYDDIEDIPLLLSIQKISEAHNYLVKLDHEKFRIDYFTNSLVNSSIYKEL